MRILILSFCIFLLHGCTPSSLDDFQHEGESKCRKIVEELQKVESRDQLARIEPVLRRHFESLIELMIQAREFQQKHPDDIPSDSGLPSTVSFQLEEQMKRIYEMEGGRELIERSQQEALIKLDAFERSVIRKKDPYRQELTK